MLDVAGGSAKVTPPKDIGGCCMMATARGCRDCDGCSHVDDPHGAGWCYMFESPPDVLPCAQHDKFKVQRNATAMLAKQHPE